MISLFVILLIINVLYRSRGGYSSFSKDKASFFKALLPFIIIIHHSGFLYKEDFQMAGAFVVALFFFISGYGLESKRLLHRIRVQDLRIALSKLLLPLVVPIIIYSLLKLLVYKIPLIDFLHNSFGSYQIVLPFTWFVLTLLILYAMFYILASVCDKLFASILISVIILASAIAVLLHFGAIYHQSVLGFVAGVLYKDNEDVVRNVLNREPQISNIFLIVLLCAVTLCCKHILSNCEYPRVYVLSFIWPVLAVMLMGYVKPIESRVVNFFTGISYELYICQGVAFLLMDGFMLPIWLNLICVIALDVVIAYLSRLATKKIEAY